LKHKVMRFSFPPSSLISCAIFSSQPDVISRLCGLIREYVNNVSKLMISYKLAFEFYESSGEAEKLTISRESLQFVNSCVMDVCNCLWRNRALNLQDSNALAFGLSKSSVSTLKEHCESQKSLNLGALYSLTGGEAFGKAALDYLRQLEDEAYDITVRHAGPPTLGSMKDLSIVRFAQISTNIKERRTATIIFRLPYRPPRNTQVTRIRRCL
jgi:centromere protein I